MVGEGCFSSKVSDGVAALGDFDVSDKVRAKLSSFSTDGRVVEGFFCECPVVVYIVCLADHALEDVAHLSDNPRQDSMKVTLFGAPPFHYWFFTEFGRDYGEEFQDSDSQVMNSFKSWVPEGGQIWLRFAKLRRSSRS